MLNYHCSIFIQNILVWFQLSCYCAQSLEKFLSICVFFIKRTPLFRMVNDGLWFIHLCFLIKCLYAYDGLWFIHLFFYKMPLFRMPHDELWMFSDMQYRPRVKESTKLRISQNKGKESENSYQNLKRSLKDRHTKTHGNCIEIYRQARPSLSIGRD